MKPRLKKTLLVLLAGALLAGSFFLQRSLNQDRDRLGLTRVQPLENAPPVRAVPPVALGGFRGLISNALWIRANELQEQDKFFEMAQLADWITKLEPHFVQVWLVQAWNMAYNISVKFKDFSDRWRVGPARHRAAPRPGPALQPNETLIYRELAWFSSTRWDRTSMTRTCITSSQWANAMAEVFDKKTPNLDELINPQPAAQKRRARLLREKYKMDPAFMKEVDQRHGPLEWRLPEAHAIYWASVGLKKAQENPDKVKPEDLITLRRVIYQSMLLTSQRRPAWWPYRLAQASSSDPNLAIIPKECHAAYEQAAEEDAPNRDHILRAPTPPTSSRMPSISSTNNDASPTARLLVQYLGQKYPDKTLIDGNTNSIPRP
jgi:hypothetical protein